MIQAEKLSVKYATGKKEILNSLSLEVKSGDIFSLVGPNGVGKTTLVKAILGMVKITHGACRILQIDTKNGLNENLKQKISFV